MLDFDFGYYLIGAEGLFLSRQYDHGLRARSRSAITHARTGCVARQFTGCRTTASSPHLLGSVQYCTRYFHISFTPLFIAARIHAVTEY